MWHRATLIGLACGVVSALLTACLVSSSLFAGVLFFAAPLPIFIAAFGWHPLLGLFSACIAAFSLSLTGSGLWGPAYALGIGAPAWALTALSLRPNPAATTPETRWYPVGHLVIWAGLIAAALVLLTVPLTASSLEEYRAMLRATLEAFLRREMALPADAPLMLGNGEDGATVINVLSRVLPPTSALVWMSMMLSNLWMAARWAHLKGRLPRPWPHLPSITLPRFTAFGMVSAFCAYLLLPGIPGFAGELLFTVLIMAFALLGLAVVHTGTRNAPSRSLILAGVYFFLLLQSWTLVLLAMLGLAEHLLHLRRRWFQENPPAASS